MHNIEDEIVAGGWKCLCAGVLLQAVQRLSSERKMHPRGSQYRMSGASGLDKEILHQKSNAKEWLAGGIGLITFEDCCDAVGVDPERAREKIESHCRSRRSVPILK